MRPSGVLRSVGFRGHGRATHVWRRFAPPLWVALFLFARGRTGLASVSRICAAIIDRRFAIGRESHPRASASRGVVLAAFLGWVVAAGLLVDVSEAATVEIRSAHGGS